MKSPNLRYAGIEDRSGGDHDDRRYREYVNKAGHIGIATMEIAGTPLILKLRKIPARDSPLG
jgi:hypothetical protein